MEKLTNMVYVLAWFKGNTSSPVMKNCMLKRRYFKKNTEKLHNLNLKLFIQMGLSEN